MPNFMEILKILPIYAFGLVQKYPIAAIVAAAVFVFILFFSNKVATILRNIYVIAVLIICVYAYFRDNWNLMTAALLTLVVLAVVRLIGYIITTIRTNRRNKRIEERALERAARRRGSWKNKQGYSGARKAIEEPKYIPGKMNQEEIEAVVNNNAAESVTVDLGTEVPAADNKETE